MEFILRIHAQEIIHFSEEILPVHKGYEINGATPFNAALEFGALLFQKAEGEGFTIWTGHYFIEEDTLLVASSKKPVLMLHFLFQDNIDITHGNLNRSFSDGQFNLSFISRMDIHASLKKSKGFFTFHIHFDYDFLQTFTNGFKKLAVFLNDIKNNQDCSITGSKHFATADMISVINSILKNPYEGKYREVHNEAHVKVLLLQVLHKIHHEDRHPGHIRLSPHDIRKLIDARNYLLAHLDTPVSIKQLARIAGVNEYKLKKGFKQLFGNTILKFQENERMDKAMELLIGTDLPVFEIALTVGYMYAHFSGVFKKRFGYPPLHFRK